MSFRVTRLRSFEILEGRFPDLEKLAQRAALNRLLKNVLDGALSLSQPIPGTAVSDQLDERP
ncbi:hypothetical protein [Roseovarius sp.]|uniref:hypothetical protein n=1 Tax=Roseovarius sp. TaxID=1486281 RepID=UPI0035636ADB